MLWAAGEPRVRGDLLSGEGCGVSIRAAKAFLGCGDRMTCGSEVMVRVSLGSRECVESRSGISVSDIVDGFVVGFWRLALASALGGNCGAVSSGGVNGETGDRT